MAHFFREGSGTSPTSFINVPVGNTVQVGLWGANVNGQVLTVSCNNPTIATASGGNATADGMIRQITIKGLQTGNVMLEARMGVGGPVWGFTQIVVGKAVAAASPIGQLAVEVAREELKAGVFEDEGNTNTGTRVDEYEKLFGMNGLAWCAMFVYWCFNTAAARSGAKNPLPKIAAAQALLTWGQRNEKLVEDPAAGDVLIVKPGTHVGLVVGPVNGGKVPSIEGNTWSHGTKDDHKDGVYEKSHPLASCYYLRV